MTDAEIPQWEAHQGACTGVGGDPWIKALIWTDPCDLLSNGGAASVAYRSYGVGLRVNS